MRIRHVVAAENVDPAGRVRDPTLARHAVIVGGRIAALSGPVDPLTHLNRDFPDHRLERCLVAEGLAVGAPVRASTAVVPPEAYRPLGRVDLGARRVAWLAALRARREAGRP